LRATDELLAQAPTEFYAATKSLQRAETFIFFAASGLVAKVGPLAGQCHRINVIHGVVQVEGAIDADFQLIHAIDRDGHSAVIAASATDQVDTVRLLADRGANLSLQDYEGLTALHWAVECGSLVTGMELVKRGADPNVLSSKKQTVLDVVACMPDKQRAALRSLTAEILRVGGKGREWSELVMRVGKAEAVGGKLHEEEIAASSEFEDVIADKSVAGRMDHHVAAASTVKFAE
jgi:hypothetical protein